jgi:hypothetical protein
MRIGITHDGDWFAAEMTEAQIALEVERDGMFPLLYEYDDGLPSYQASTPSDEERLHRLYATGEGL